MGCRCAKAQPSRGRDDSIEWAFPIGAKVTADRAMSRLPQGTIATVTWPIPEQTEFALGMMPPISNGTSVPISWELDGTRWFMFCPMDALRAVEGEG